MNSIKKQKGNKKIAKTLNNTQNRVKQQEGKTEKFDNQSKRAKLPKNSKTDKTKKNLIKCSVALAVELDNAGGVPAPVNVIRCAPHGQKALVVEHVLEPVHHQLVRSDRKFEVVEVAELFFGE